MSTIKTNLSSNEFIKMHGDSVYVKDFSIKAVEALLSFLDETHSDEDDIEWGSVFMNAAEYTPEAFYHEFKKDIYFYDLEDVIVNILGDNITLYDGCDYVATSQIKDASVKEDDYKIMGINDIVAMFEPTLICDSGFIEASYNAIETSPYFTLCQKLTNGNRLVIK